MKIASYLKDILKYSVQYACITHCVFEYVGDFVVCNGPSMEPTLFSNNILLTERITSRFYKPNRGDIIVAISPTNPDQYICKRIVGLPGDKVIMDKTVDIKEEKIDESPRSRKEAAYIVKFEDDYIPRGYVWVEGDNQKNSSDSRYYGPIPLGLIKSRAICRVWPLKDMKVL